MLDEEDRKVYENLKPPRTIVVRYGYQRKIAELSYHGDATPGCGSKLVAVTDRGTELVEMLTTTCDNSGCGKSVSRKQMLDYIDNSGGKHFPFSNHGKILRIATHEDLNEMTHLETRRPEMIKRCKRLIVDLKLEMQLAEVEQILGDERVTFYFTAEDRVDFRELVLALASEYQTRIEMVQVNDREEARLVADYEKCGQHCCCRQFLKVLKPVSMRSAKVQKNTLDPHKISGRCGRLMCCLRYEDETYADLKKKLPHRKTLVETEDGVGIVWSTQILTQLALVKIEGVAPAAYPIESIRPLDKAEIAAWREEHGDPSQVRNDGQRRPAQSRPPQKTTQNASKKPAPVRRPKPGKPLNDSEVKSKEDQPSAKLPKSDVQSTPSKGYGNDTQANRPDATQAGDDAPSGDQAPKKKRRRRRRRRKGGGQGGDSSGGGSPPSRD